MKLGKFLLITLVLSLFYPFILSSQATDDYDDIKITTTNVMIYKLYKTRLGLAVEYYAGGKIRRAYFPHRFFMNKTVVTILEGDYQITPQMNIVYKNQELFKVKLYIPPIPDGYIYQILENMPQDMVDDFNAVTKLEVELSDEK